MIFTLENKLIILSKHACGVKNIFAETFEVSKWISCFLIFLFGVYLLISHTFFEKLNWTVIGYVFFISWIFFFVDVLSQFEKWKSYQKFILDAFIICSGYIFF